MLLFFLCPASTTSASSCQRSFPGTSSAPTSFGCTAAASSCPCSGPTTAPTPSCATAPSPSPSESGPGTRLFLSADSSPARMRMPSQAVCDAAANRPVQARWPNRPLPAAAVHPHPGGSCFQTQWSLHHHTRNS
jgi:hypothetical protein